MKTIDIYLFISRSPDWKLTETPLLKDSEILEETGKDPGATDSPASFLLEVIGGPWLPIPREYLHTRQPHRLRERETDLFKNPQVPSHKRHIFFLTQLKLP